MPPRYRLDAAESRSSAAVRGDLGDISAIFRMRRYCSAQPSAIGIIQAMRCCLRNPHFRAYVASELIFFFSLTMILTGLPYYIEAPPSLISSPSSPPITLAGPSYM